MRRRWRFHGWNVAWRREQSQSFIRTNRCGIQFAATRASPTCCGAWAFRRNPAERLGQNERIYRFYILSTIIFNPPYTPSLFSFTRATVLTFPLIPLSFAYAILRHQVIPVSLIIRRRRWVLL